MRLVDVDKPVVATWYSEDDIPHKEVVTISELLAETVEVLEEDVVRCRDCVVFKEHEWSTKDDGSRYCHFVDGYRSPDFYCGDGERKVEENE